MDIALRGAARITSLVEGAAESVEKSGIACTSALETTLFNEMNGLCRTLMSELLAYAAQMGVEYNTEVGERNAGKSSKKIVTLFGETENIARNYYYNSETGQGHYPFDDALGLVGRHTPAAATEMMRCAARLPFREAAGEFSRSHGFEVSADTVRHVVEKCKGRVVEFTKSSGLDAPGDASAPDALVYIMADGTGVPFRKKDLKGVKGKNGRAKTREVKIGAVFVGSNTEANEPHRNLDTTTYVATTNRSGKFGKILRGEFDRRFHEKPTTTIYISDGGKWLHTIHENEFPFAVEILDLYHAIEHLKPLMLGLGIKEGTKEWDSRHHYWAKCIKSGKTADMLNYIWKNMKDKLHGDAMREYKYYRSNLSRMKYDEYRAKGWFVGSGVIESGCKTVIGQRFKQSGMIWSLHGVEALLPLRTLLKSNRLDEFFRYMVKDLSQVEFAA